MALKQPDAGVSTRNQFKQIVEVAFTGVERQCDLSEVRKVSKLKAILERECNIPQGSQIVLIGKPYRHPTSTADVQAELSRVDAQRRNMFVYDRREIDAARKSGTAGTSGDETEGTGNAFDISSESAFRPTESQKKSFGGVSLQEIGRPLHDTPENPVSLLRVLEGELPEELRLAAARQSAALSSGSAKSRGVGEGGAGQPAREGSTSGAAGGGGSEGTESGGAGAGGKKLDGPALAVFLAMRSKFARVVGWHRMARQGPQVLRARVSGGVSGAQRAGVRVRALDAAVSNLVDVAAGSLRRFEGFYRRFATESGDRKSIIARAAEYCERLAQVKLHPALPTGVPKDPAADGEVGTPASSEGTGPKARTGTLLDHVDRDGVLRWARSCGESEGRLIALGAALHAEVSAFFERCKKAAKEPAVPEDVSKGIRDRVQRLEARAEKGWEAAEKARSASQQAVGLLHAVVAGLARATGRSADAAGMEQMQDSRQALDALQRQLEDELLPALWQDDGPLLEDASGICAAENFVLNRLRSRMALVSEMHREISSMNKRMQQLSQAEKLQRSAVAHIRRVRGMPAAYTAALREVARRRAFLRSYVAQVREVWDELEKARTRESQRRVQFHRMHGGVLPTGLIPGIEERAPVFEVRWEGVVSRLPRIDNVEDPGKGLDGEVGEEAVSGGDSGDETTAADVPPSTGTAGPSKAETAAAASRSDAGAAISGSSSDGSRVRELRLAEVTLEQEEGHVAGKALRRLGLQAEVAGLKAELAQMAQWYAQGSGLSEEAMREYMDEHTAISGSDAPEGKPSSDARLAPEGAATVPVAEQHAAEVAPADSRPPLLTSPDSLPDTLPWSTVRVPTRGYSLMDHLASATVAGEYGGAEAVAEQAAGTGLAAGEAGIPGPVGAGVKISIPPAGGMGSAAGAGDTSDGGGGDDSVFDFVVSPVVGSELRADPVGLLAPSSSGGSLSQTSRPLQTTPISSDDASKDDSGGIGRASSAGSAERGGSRVVRRLQAPRGERHLPQLLSGARPTGRLTAGQALWRVLMMLRDSRALDAAEDAEAVGDLPLDSVSTVADTSPQWLSPGGGKTGDSAAAVAMARLRASHSEGEMPGALMRGLGLLNVYDVDSQGDTDGEEESTAISGQKPLGLVLADSQEPSPTSSTPHQGTSGQTTPDSPAMQAAPIGAAAGRRRGASAGALVRRVSSTPGTRELGSLANLRPGRVVDQLRRVLRFLEGLRQSNAALSEKLAKSDRERRERAVIYGSIAPRDIVVFHARHVPDAAGYSGQLLSHPAEAHARASSTEGLHRGKGGSSSKRGKRGKSRRGSGRSVSRHHGRGRRPTTPTEDGRPRGESDRSSEAPGAAAPAFVYEAVLDRGSQEGGASGPSVGKVSRVLLRSRCADRAVTMAGGGWPSVVVAQVSKVLRRSVPGHSASESVGGVDTGDGGSSGDAGSSRLGSSATGSEGRFSPAGMDEPSDDDLGTALLRFGLDPGAAFSVAAAEVLFVDEDEKED